MKTRIYHILWSVLTSESLAFGQGTLVYDQQSTTTSFFGNSGFPIDANQPMGQSFMPSLSAVGFVQFRFLDFPQNGIGATVYVNLRTDSITGSVLAATSPVSIPDGSSGVKTLLFPVQVTVVPGSTYYLQPVVESGDHTVTGLGSGSGVSYLAGTSYFQGAPHPSDIDLGFREGIVIPEPSTIVVVWLGAIFFLRRACRCARWRKWNAWCATA